MNSLSWYNPFSTFLFFFFRFIFLEEKSFYQLRGTSNHPHWGKIETCNQINLELNPSSWIR
ncbi:hypothetical protein CAAN1_21S02388 [[Candida] anglica]|uniref:Uncharacterized protein n=1 Tax=[Candida] anglica TaxID=148631 RepID=A0ABP0EE23_9ASCO